MNVIAVAEIPSAPMPVTRTDAAVLAPGVTVTAFVLLLARSNDGDCARPGTTMSNAVARNRTVLLKCV